MNKLKEDGFKDIENVDSPLEFLKTWDSTYFIDKTDTFAETDEYYRTARALLVTHEFESDLEMVIWELHTEGLSVRDIEAKIIADKLYAWHNLLENKKIVEKYNKDAINAVIQRLQKFIGRR